MISALHINYIGRQSMRRLKLAFFIILTTLLVNGNAYALMISGPIDYTTSGLVGTADAGTGAVNVSEEAIWAQQILDLAANTKVTILGVNYRTHDTDDYTGVINASDYTKDDSENNHIAAGWEYLMAKYDGQNAGYVMYYLGGDEAWIPSFSDDIWVNGQNNGYQLSHWTAFNSMAVPEPSIIALFAAGLFGLGFARRRMRS